MAKKTYKKTEVAHTVTSVKKDKTIKKIGSIPLGYSEKDIVFMEDNKIFIKKK